MKILILGGYGVFGGRLAGLLSDLPGLTLFIAGRSASKANEFCNEFDGVAEAVPLVMDRNQIDGILKKLSLDLVVDASGPFQDYGDDRYGVVKACIATRVPYLDFADAADFVFGVSQFDTAAREAGIFVLSGVSSFPVLTAAVLREMATDMQIQGVEGGIAPSPYAGIGLNVMRAVVGYAGGPVRLMRNGVPTTAIGLTESRRFTIAPPGKMPLRNLCFSLVDVPDLQVIPPEHRTLREIWMGAGPVPEILHRLLNMLAKARAVFNLPTLTPLSPLFYRVLNLMRFGEHRGGMYVQVNGLQGGQPVKKSWHLLAEGDHGPYIPSMAIEAIIRKILKGCKPEAGARPATQALSLADYRSMFQGRSIDFGIRDDSVKYDRIYQQLLGSAFEQLPTKIRAFHGGAANQVWRGEATVARGNSIPSRLVAWCLNFPAAGSNVPIEVTVIRSADNEIWQRDFDGELFQSTQRPGTGRQKHLLIEKFGPIRVALALVLKADRLYLIPRQWSVLGVPLPKLLLPDGESLEAEKDGAFQFDVTIKAPIFGVIVAYCGMLKVVEPIEADCG